MRLEDFLETAAKKAVFARGQMILSAGAQATAAYLVIKGQIEIFKAMKDREAVVATLGPGEILGEMALLRYDTYTLSARASADTAVYIITPEILHEQMRLAHPLLKLLISTLVERVHTMNELLIDLDSAGHGG
ncbi:MAG: cyclic nucleotide-binding domain-containing protein [Alphaproteobacteria bacterium]|nr:cyclic nucleotide-binding domain-containing protein [Alphaproteobacteria bacterium]